MKELQRVKVMERLSIGDLSYQEAADELGITRRHAIRLRVKYKTKGEKGLIHGNRGRRPQHAIDEEIRSLILSLYQQKYYDFNFSHFTERLNEEERVKVSRSSVVRILKAEGIKSKKSVKRKPKLHRGRVRRAAAGELWQTDATTFQWFEGDAEYYTLHAYIDDATGAVVGAYFTKNECTAGYVEALRRGVEKYGMPMEIYSDRHTIFRSPKELSEEEKAEGKQEPLSNFGEGLKELGIHQIFARTPQAKGRIERLWETLQDRLKVELRVHGIKDIEGANRFLPQFLQSYNAKFEVKAREESVYVPLDRKIDFNFLFGHRDTRKTDRGGTISYKGSSYTPCGEVVCPGLACASVEVRETLDGRIFVIHRGKPIEMRKMDKAERVNKPAEVEKKSRPVTPHKPAPNHPWRRSPIGKAKRDYDTTNAAPFQGVTLSLNT